MFVGENPRLILFGSLMTGLALESSDIDMAVTGLKIDDRTVMIMKLQNLANVLQEWKCLENFKSIDTASIPVIKMVLLPIAFTFTIDFESGPTAEELHDP